MYLNKMLKPVNGHLIIEPLKHESFMSSEKGTYEEIGVVINAGDWIALEKLKVGDKVYFDSWLAAKYPNEKEGEFFWLVKWDDVRAVETNENEDPIPK